MVLSVSFLIPRQRRFSYGDDVQSHLRNISISNKLDYVGIVCLITESFSPSIFYASSRILDLSETSFGARVEV